MVARLGQAMATLVRIYHAALASDLDDRANAAFFERRYRITLNCWDLSTRTLGARTGGEAESAEISSDMSNPEMAPTSAKP